MSVVLHEASAVPEVPIGLTPSPQGLRQHDRLAAHDSDRPHTAFPAVWSGAGAHAMKK
jgi:hypothetical protein